MRAEQIRIAAAPDTLQGLDLRFEGGIVDAIFEGERIAYEVAVPELGGVFLRVFDHDPASHTEYRPGDKVRLGWNVKDMHVFARSP